jgi:GDP-mannose 6-dehydrogenase
MDIAIIGMGYVGCVSAACLTKSGFRVLANDLDEDKTMAIGDGKATISEPHVDGLIEMAVKNGALRATNSLHDCVLNSHVCVITVGTPLAQNGNLNLNSVFDLAHQIGVMIKRRHSPITFVLRSTVSPGTSERFGKIVAIESGKTCGKDFSVVYNPEFLREGSAVDDFFAPGTIVIGTATGRTDVNVEKMYEGIDGEIFVVDYRTAELIKYLCNSWHAIKVAFANEVGVVANRAGANTKNLIDVFLSDKKLNLSGKYLRPGEPFGGSCLPKDLSGLNHLAKDLDVEVPLLKSVAISNEIHKGRFLDLIKAKAPTKNIGFYGLTFKPHTDDIRNSPFLAIMRMLKLEGYNVCAFDCEVDYAIKFNRNVKMLRSTLGDLEKDVCTTLEEMIKQSDLICCATQPDQLLSEFDLVNKKLINLSVANSIMGFMGLFGAGG